MFNMLLYYPYLFGKCLWLQHILVPLWLSLDWKHSFYHLNDLLNSFACESKNNVFLKTKIISFPVWLDDHWDVRYIRQCALNGTVGMYDGRICQERYGSYNVRMRYCHCDNQDGCNSAPATVSRFSQFLPYLVTLIAALMPYVLVQRWCSEPVLLSIQLPFVS